MTDDGLDFRKRPTWASGTQRLHLLRCDSAENQLADLMSRLSERCFHAKWLVGISHTLWALTFELRDHTLVDDVVHEHEVLHLRQLAVTLKTGDRKRGGWIEWADGDGLNLDGVEGEGPRVVAWSKR